MVFPDDDPSPAGTPGFTNESVNNITINRLYTGFMQLTKEAQILDANGVIVQAFTDVQADLDGKLRPDYQIEYRITYENISTPVVGTGNVNLTATDFEIVEDGTGGNTGSPDNNWADVTDHEQNTSATQGSVQYFTNSADTDAQVLTTSDPVARTQVEKYENPVGQVDPGQTGNFQFRRRLR